MKDWIKRWLSSEVENLGVVAIEKLAAAKDAHISDLRVLLDKSAAREEQLSAMVKMVMEDRYFRPAIPGKPAENRTTAAVAPEHMQDVATFDEKSDQEQSEAEGVRQGELQAELDELLAEHAEAHTE